ncbi:MAG: hypothetical protein OER90_20965 [Gemmatimonadota bacterium]|nr:hypothetical protein [Gemmatimonadota bacterium]
MSRATILGALFAIACGAPPPPNADQQQGTSASPLEGTFEYVGTLKGQAILANGRFVFLYGPPDGSAPMTADAGTYQIAGDSATGKNLYSADTARVGVIYRWTAESWSGDTMAYVVMNDSGRVTGRGRALKLR